MAKKEDNKLPGTDSANHLQQMPEQRDLSSPADFSGFIDVVKITPVVKYLAAQEPSQGTVRALPGFWQPQGLACSSNLAQLPAVVKQDFASESADPGVFRGSLENKEMWERSFCMSLF